MSENDNTGVEKVKFMKRGPIRGNIRESNKRVRVASESESTSEGSDSPIVLPKSDSLFKPIGITATTRTTAKYNTKQMSSSDSEGEPAMASYRSRRVAESENPRDMGATSELKMETDHSIDHQALHQKSIELNRQVGSEDKGEGTQEVYRGINNYKKLIEPRDTVQGNASSGMVRKGPVRAPLYLRSTVRWDYQPDICKDYKETGVCGFGDSCKFLHDRSDYKFGWQLEREEEEKMKATREGKAGRGTDNFEVSSEDEGDDLPFACLICRERFTNPIMTKCKHYFCQECALKRYKKNKRCYLCGKQTNGTFTPAKHLIEKIEKKTKMACRKLGAISDSD